uniref:Uncharacterized protein n=1 Tax=viral metagenome TaxID=1070528 RepID=A0A6C0H845_9ZZZZ
MPPNIFIIIILIILLFYCVGLPYLNSCYNKTINNLEGLDNINNIYYELNKIDLNKCSKDCCNFTEWPIPHIQKVNNSIPTNYSCNLGNGSGCVCINELNINNLTHRGYNN